MKIGKLPEPMLIRSVLKEVQHRREEVLVGPAVGQDCAVMELKEGEVFVLSSDPITGTAKNIGRHSVHITANDLAASGADPVGIMITILLTPDTEEAELKEMMRGVESACKELNMEVMGEAAFDFSYRGGKNEEREGTDHSLCETGTGYCNYQMDWPGGNLYCGQRDGAKAFRAFFSRLYKDGSGI